MAGGGVKSTSFLLPNKLVFENQRSGPAWKSNFLAEFEITYKDGTKEVFQDTEVAVSIIDSCKVIDETIDTPFCPIDYLLTAYPSISTGGTSQLNNDTLVHQFNTVNYKIIERDPNGSSITLEINGVDKPYKGTINGIVSDGGWGNIAADVLLNGRTVTASNYNHFVAERPKLQV